MNSGYVLPTDEWDADDGVDLTLYGPSRGDFVYLPELLRDERCPEPGYTAWDWTMGDYWDVADDEVWG